MKYVAVAGTFDNKAAELNYVADRLKDAGVNVRTLDFRTSNYSEAETEVTADEIAEFRPEGKGAAFQTISLRSKSSNARWHNFAKLLPHGEHLRSKR